ncbi:signal transduction histidine kinase [Catenulispora sp. GP43]|uniref:sensor histidine kinase n=1 Tax=Catenulispora sp. GP43 TaxID=3156263 RepID=UPI003513B3C9
MAALTANMMDRKGYFWGIQALRSGGLVALSITLFGVNPKPGLHGRGLAITITLAVVAVAWIGMIVFDIRKWRIQYPLFLLALSGGVLSILQQGPAIFVPAVAAFSAGSNLEPQISTAVAVAGALSLTATALVVGASTTAVLGFVVILATALAMGMIRYAIAQRADTAEQLLEQTLRASAAETEAAVLGERTRIAREIHDILAHSLGALAMQVEAAQALLTREDPDIAKALRCMERVGQLTREGLVESRRAVQALREDIGPLSEMIRALVEADGGTMTTTGEPRKLPADAALALYRTAQEAVTNARKHAPGKAADVRLSFDEDTVRLTVTNHLAEADAARPLTNSGGGFGLSGLRERMELAGGTLDAGREGDDWSVRAVVPG